MTKDIEFAKKTLDALDRYEKSKFNELDEESFVAELEKW